MSDAICSVPDCEKRRAKITWCEMHYWRQHRTGSLEGSGRAPRDLRPPMERFTRPSIEECWEWNGVRDDAGYGRLRVSKRNTKAHRFVYEQLVGPIPDGLQIDHLCRNTSCVNPTHLEPVPLLVNLSRSTNKVRFALLFNTCCHGHPFTPENTGRHSTRGTRYCKTCRHNRYLRVKQEKAEAAASQERKAA